jgi:hypothetical protein
VRTPPKHNVSENSDVLLGTSILDHAPVQSAAEGGPRDTASKPVSEILDAADRRSGLLRRRTPVAVSHGRID